eukprot:TRINITY_DN21272_c0_g2_i2.p1 TRINITY_DN21272_c0_g2~~TRINITY_DN21272_c0_g2_i2.p1  ORF type:complete len:986 (-),score=291.92 TRINITY_DN21272_c0_g2_i2:291-3248(-)
MKVRQQLLSSALVFAALCSIRRCGGLLLEVDEADRRAEQLRGTAELFKEEYQKLQSEFLERRRLWQEHACQAEKPGLLPQQQWQRSYASEVTSLIQLRQRDRTRLLRSLSAEANPEKHEDDRGSPGGAGAEEDDEYDRSRKKEHAEKVAQDMAIGMEAAQAALQGSETGKVNPANQQLLQEASSEDQQAEQLLARATQSSGESQARTEEKLSRSQEKSLARLKKALNPDEHKDRMLHLDEMYEQDHQGHLDHHDHDPLAVRIDDTGKFRKVDSEALHRADQKLPQLDHDLDHRDYLANAGVLDQADADHEAKFGREEAEVLHAHGLPHDALATSNGEGYLHGFPGYGPGGTAGNGVGSLREGAGGGGGSFVGGAGGYGGGSASAAVSSGGGGAGGAGGAGESQTHFGIVGHNYNLAKGQLEHHHGDADFEHEHHDDFGHEGQHLDHHGDNDFDEDDHHDDTHDDHDHFHHDQHAILHIHSHLEHLGRLVREADLEAKIFSEQQALLDKLSAKKLALVEAKQYDIASSLLHEIEMQKESLAVAEKRKKEADMRREEEAFEVARCQKVLDGEIARLELEEKEAAKEDDFLCAKGLHLEINKLKLMRGDTVVLPHCTIKNLRPAAVERPNQEWRNGMSQPFTNAAIKIINAAESRASAKALYDVKQQVAKDIFDKKKAEIDGIYHKAGGQGSLFPGALEETSEKMQAIQDGKTLSRHGVLGEEPLLPWLKPDMAAPPKPFLPERFPKLPELAESVVKIPAPGAKIILPPSDAHGKATMGEAANALEGAISEGLEKGVPSAGAISAGLMKVVPSSGATSAGLMKGVPSWGSHSLLAATNGSGDADADATSGCDGAPGLAEAAAMASAASTNSGGSNETAVSEPGSAAAASGAAADGSASNLTETPETPEQAVATSLAALPAGAALPSAAGASEQPAAPLTAIDSSLLSAALQLGSQHAGQRRLQRVCSGAWNDRLRCSSSACRGSSSVA